MLRAGDRVGGRRRVVVAEGDAPFQGGMVMTCAKCGTVMEDSEQYCSACGAAAAQRFGGSIERMQEHGAVSSARKLLLAISILTVLSGLFFYAIQSSKVEDEIREAEQVTADMDAAERDALMKQETGMTFAEAIAHDRGQVKLLLLVNLVLGGIYVGLWRWAKSNPFMAAVTALILFLGVHVISAVVEPKTLVQGVIIKILFTVGLIHAVKAGAEARRAMEPHAT